MIIWYPGHILATKNTHYYTELPYWIPSYIPAPRALILPSAPKKNHQPFQHLHLRYTIHTPPSSAPATIKTACPWAIRS